MKLKLRKHYAYKGRRFRLDRGLRAKTPSFLGFPGVKCGVDLRIPKNIGFPKAPRHEKPGVQDLLPLSAVQCSVDRSS